MSTGSRDNKDNYESDNSPRPGSDQNAPETEALALATEQEILLELARRNDVLLVLTMNRPKIGDSCDVCDMTVTGSTVTAAALATRASVILMQKLTQV